MNAKKLLIIPALLIALGAWAQEVNLTMTPATKTKYNIEINSVMDISQNMSGMEIKINGTNEIKATMEIEDVAADGNFTVLYTWNEIKSSSSAMGQDTTMFFDDLNVVMRTIYNKTGEIVTNEFVGTPDSSNPGVAMVEQAATGLRLPLLPGKSVNKDETWKTAKTDTINAPGTPFVMVSEAEEKYLFAGVESQNGNEYYIIKVEGPSKITGEGSQMGMQMQIEGTGSGEGFTLLDKKTLFPVYSENKLGLDMNILVSGPQSMAIPMTQNVTTITKFIEVK